jgi:cell division protein FtsW (lipid II flippase)
MTTATLTPVRTRVPTGPGPARTSVPSVQPLLLASAALLALGIVLVYSSSAAHAAKTYGDPEHFLALHLLRALAGVGLGLALYRLDGAWLQRYSSTILVLTLVLLVLVLIPGIGVVRGKSTIFASSGPSFPKASRQDLIRSA